MEVLAATDPAFDPLPDPPRRMEEPLDSGLNSRDVRVKGVGGNLGVQKLWMGVAQMTT